MFEYSFMMSVECPVPPEKIVQRVKMSFFNVLFEMFPVEFETWIGNNFRLINPESEFSALVMMYQKYHRTDFEIFIYNSITQGY